MAVVCDAPQQQQTHTLSGVLCLILSAIHHSLLVLFPIVYPGRSGEKNMAELQPRLQVMLFSMYFTGFTDRCSAEEVVFFSFKLFRLLCAMIKNLLLLLSPCVFLTSSGPADAVYTHTFPDWQSLHILIHHKDGTSTASPKLTYLLY